MSTTVLQPRAPRKRLSGSTMAAIFGGAVVAAALGYGLSMQNDEV